jgi:hypothetical protein
MEVLLTFAHDLTIDLLKLLPIFPLYSVATLFQQFEQPSIA